MDFQSSPLPRLVYLDPPPPPPAPHQWSHEEQQQDQGGVVDHQLIEAVRVQAVHHEEEYGSGAARPGGSMAVRARLAKLSPPEASLKCPRCESTNTKFCYFNNYSLTQPRHFCKTCRRYWTRGGALRNVPVGGGCRRRTTGKNTNKRKRGPKSPIPNSKPNYSGDILDNFLTQSTHPVDPLIISDHHRYGLQADIYGPVGMGSSGSALGFVLGNRFHNNNSSEPWIRPGPAPQFPYMDPNPVLASEIVDDHHPLMKVELGSVGLNLLGSGNINNIDHHDDRDHQYWAEGGNDNVMMMMMMSNNNNNINNDTIIASSAWTSDHHHLSRFVHMTSSSSTPTTHDLLM